LRLAHQPARANDNHGKIKHVLLISVDGLHEVDVTNYLASHSGSAFARLRQHGVSYTNASTSRPSDSFPGLVALVTGGSPRTAGVYYDDSYDRKLSPVVIG
jgi:predicted AlkP superfamily pyrophosphatase or phosphodiesterase